MKKIRQQNPLILALAIIGLCAIFYFLFQAYQQYRANQRARQFFNAPPSGGAAQLYKPSKKPPPQ
jgi:hypothetical protein